MFFKKTIYRSRTAWQWFTLACHPLWSSITMPLPSFSDSCPCMHALLSRHPKWWYFLNYRKKRWNPVHLFKGRISRICWLQFVSTTFKVGPSVASSRMRAYAWSLHFYVMWVPHSHTLCAVMGRGYTPTAQRLTETSPTKKKSKWRQRADANNSTHI